MMSFTWRRMRSDEVGGLAGWRNQQAKPPGAVHLGADLIAAEQIALGHHTGEFPRLVDHQQAGDTAFQHGPGRCLHGVVRGNGNDVPCHHIGNDHLAILSLLVETIHKYAVAVSRRLGGGDKLSLRAGI